MFSNLSKGSVLYGLDNKKDTHFTAVVDMVTLPYSKNQHPTFGQLPEMVVDIVANVNGDRKEFKQVPCNNAIADFGPDALVLADSKDSLSNYVRSLRQTSKNIVDSYPVHKERIPKYDKILQELNPELVNDSVIKELKEQVGSLQSQLAETLALLKKGNKKE